MSAPSILPEPHSYLGKRLEFKYPMSLAQAAEIERYLIRIGMRPDGYAGIGPYLVNSIYFDTPHLSDYRDKDASLLARRKVRARMYEKEWHDRHERVWLEVKRKRNMSITKMRTTIEGGLWNQFFATNDARILTPLDPTNTKEKADCEHFAFVHMRHLYRPHVAICYRRQAYIDRFVSTVRITFDTDISAHLIKGSTVETQGVPVLPHQAIMEVKFNHHMPWWFTELVNRYQLERSDFSKYRNGAAMLRGLYRIPVPR